MIAQFYNLITKMPYMYGHPFPADSPLPEGDGWVKVLSRKRVKVDTLGKKARKQANECLSDIGFIAPR